MMEVCYTALILAAGCGRRAGGYKPLWRIAESAVIDLVIRSAASVCSRIRVVGGYEFQRLKAHLDRFGWDQIELRENTNWTAGMFSSIQIGLICLDTPVFIHPADVAGVTAMVYQKLASAATRSHDDLVFRPAYQGRAGHPVLLMPKAVTIVREAPSSGNLRDILKRVTPRRDVPVDDEFVLWDFDTQEKFEELEKRILSLGLAQK